MGSSQTGTPKTPTTIALSTPPARSAPLHLPDTIRFSLDHSHWALRSLLDAMSTLTPAQLEQDFNIGPGGLRVNLAHTLECMVYFAGNFADRDYAEPAEFAQRSATVEGLRSLLNDAQRDLDAALTAYLTRGAPDRVFWPNAPGGKLSAAAALAQIFDHAALHRTQAINILKRLGVTPLPDLDPLTFASMSVD